MDSHSCTGGGSCRHPYHWLTLLLLLFIFSSLPGCFSGGEDGTVLDETDSSKSAEDEPESTETPDVSTVLLSGSSATVEPDTQKEVTITATVTDANRITLADVPISFSATDGHLNVENKISDEAGESSAIFTVPAMAEGESVTVVATAGNQSANFVIYASAESDNSTSTLLDTKLDIYADSLILPTGTSGSVQILAFARNSNNAVLEGEEIVFSSNYGSLSSDRVQTNASGYASTLLSSPHEHSTGEPVTITAKHVNCPSYGESATDCRKQITLTTKGAFLTIDGPDATVGDGQIVSFNITLKDGTGSPLADQIVDVAINNELIHDEDLTINGELVYEKNDDCTETSCPFVTNSQGLVTVTTQVHAGNSETNLVTASALPENGINAASSQFQINVSKTNSIAINYPDSVISNPKLLGPIGATGTDLSLELALASNGTANQEVELFSSLGTLSNMSGTISGQTIKLNTDSDGKIAFRLQSNTAGTATINAIYSSGGSASQVETEREFSFYAVEADQILLEASPTTISFGQESAVIATVKDQQGNLVRFREVVFHVESDITGGKLKDAKSVVTDEYGRATTIYTAGFNATGEDPNASLGVEITASVLDANGVIEQDTANNDKSVSTTIVVEPVNTTIVLGTGNKINEPNTTQFSKDFVVQINDNGIPVQNSKVNLLVFPNSYAKGYAFRIDSNGDGEVDRWATSGTDHNGITKTTRQHCNAEDSNKNGLLDGAETDHNSDGGITPESTVVSVDTAEISTDENGFGYFTLTFPQNYAWWIGVDLEVRSSHNDGEAKDIFSYTPGLSAVQITNMEAGPANEYSPFGSVYYDPAETPGAGSSYTPDPIACTNTH